MTFLVSLFVLFWGIYYLTSWSDGRFSMVATTATILCPLIISVVVAPKQKSNDYSEKAARAVHDLEELRRSQKTVVEDLEGINSKITDDNVKLDIYKSIEEINRQCDQVWKSILEWAEVSPTAVEDAVNRQVKNHDLLARMEEGWNDREQSK